MAVSPLIGGRAVRGPLDRMMPRLVGGTTPEHVTKCYKGLLDALVIDRADAPAQLDVAVVVADTLMTDREAARRLAEDDHGGSFGDPDEDRPDRRNRELRNGARRSPARCRLRGGDRLARPGAARAAAAAELGVEGATNEDAAAGGRSSSS